MIEQYKVGDRVLWDAKIGSIATNGKIWLTSMADESRGICSIDPKEIRPYTPRQEFEYGEEVEVQENDSGSPWHKQIFLGFIKGLTNPYFTTSKENFEGKQAYYESTLSFSMWSRIRKLNTKPRDTITIGNTTYDKVEFENAVKDLKPIGEVK